jgi:hypothetical protein
MKPLIAVIYGHRPEDVHGRELVLGEGDRPAIDSF